MASGDFPAAYDTKQLAAKVVFLDQKEVEQFTYEMPQIDATPIQDFNLEGLRFHLGVNDDQGWAELLINDNNKALVNTTPLADSVIKKGWQIQIYLGKDSTNLTRRFWGIILTTEVIQRQTNSVKIRIFAESWGRRAAERISILQHNQKKAADGLTVDDTDNNAKALKLLERIFTKKDHWSLGGLPLETQTQIPDMEAYITFNDDILDKRKQNHGSYVVDDSTINNGHNAANSVIVLGQVEVTQVTGLPPGGIVDGLSIDIVTSAGNIRIKAYNDVSGTPSRLLGESGSVAAPAAGIQEIAYTSPFIIPADGIVWFGFEADNVLLDLKETTGLPSGTTKTDLHTYGAGPNPFVLSTNLTTGWWFQSHHKKILTTASFVRGQVGQAFQHDGNDRIQLANEALFDREFTDKIFCSFWLYIPAAVAADFAIITKSLNLTTGVGYKIHFANTGTKLIFTLADGTTAFSVETSTVTKDVWHHYMFEYDGSSNETGMEIYVDNVLDTQAQVSAAISVTIQNNEVLTIGANSATPSTDIAPSGVRINEFRFYKPVTDFTVDQRDGIFNTPFRIAPLNPDPDIKIASMQAKSQTFMFLASRIASMTGIMWIIDGDRQLHFNLPENNNSGIRVTNDLQSTDTTAHDQDKIGFIDRPMSWSDSIARGGHSVLHGVGTASDTLDIQQTAENSALDLEPLWFAIPFTPTQDSLRQVSVRFRRTGIITDQMIFEIVGANSAGTLPDRNDKRVSRIISQDTLNTIENTGFEWFEIAFEKIQVTEGEQLFVILSRHGDATNRLDLAFDDSTGDHFDSPTGATFTVRTGLGTIALRTYPSRAVDFLLYNASAVRRFGIREKTLQMRDFPTTSTVEQLLLGIAPVIGRVRRIMPTISCTPITDDFHPGSYVTIFDKNTGMGRKSVIIGVDFIMDSTDQTNIGVKSVELQLEEFAL